MHIIITRPKEDSLDLINKLINLGHSVTHIPVIKIEKLEIKKVNLETSSGSLIHIIFNDLGKDKSADYLNNAQGLTNNFLLQAKMNITVRASKIVKLILCFSIIFIVFLISL